MTNKQKRKNRASGCIVTMLLAAALFVILKTGGIVEWSWVVVFAPVWFPLTMFAITSLLCVVICAVCGIVKGVKEHQSDNENGNGGGQTMNKKDTATPKGIADGIAVYCAHDVIVKTADLKPNPRNPNKHPADQIKRLGKIIRHAGWRNPITVSTRSGMIVKGHGRLLAAMAEGLKEAPVDYQDYESDAAELADLTADNHIAEMAEMDNKLLVDIFADIDTGEFPFEVSGYTDKDRDALAAELAQAITGEAAADDYADIPTPAKPVTQRGDVWVLDGKHRVMCGDATSRHDRDMLLNGAMPEILITDPPYCSGGFQESGRSSGSIGTDRVDGNIPTIANDTLSTRGYQSLMARVLDGASPVIAYIFTDWRMWVNLFDIVESSGFGVRSMIVWDKKSPGMGAGWRAQHELCMFALRTKPKFDKHKGYGNVIQCSRTGNELHPTQKPVELFETLLDNTTWASGVYDPFAGSGTTLIAALRHGQTAYCMELTPEFTDVIIRRYIRATNSTNVKCYRKGTELDAATTAAIYSTQDEGGEKG